MTRCVAPWHSLLIKAHGGVFPDGQFQVGYGSIHNQDLASLWMSPRAVQARKDFARNFWPEECAQCALKEKSVGHSRRLFFRDVLEPSIPTPAFDPQAEPDIYYLEINTSNLCNLKCVMCNGQISSAWIKDERAMQLRSPIYERPPATKVKFTKAHSTLMGNLFKDPNHFRNLSYLSLRGGEPFQDPMNKDIVRFFIDQGTAKNIVLDIGTNGTIYDEELCAMFDSFKLVKLNISIEATGELYQYIRGGKHFTQEQLEDNIKRFSNLDNTEIHFVTLAMAYNLWNLGELRDWLISIRQPNHRITFKNIVVNPRYLDPHVIPSPHRLALDFGASQDLLDYEAETYDSGFIVMTKKLRDETIPSKDRAALLEQFRSFTRDLDDLRGTSITEIVPALAEIL